MSPTTFVSPIETLDPFVLTAAAPVFRADFTGDFLVCIGADEAFDVYLNKGTRVFRMGPNDSYRMPVDENGTQTIFEHVEFRRIAGAVVANNTVQLLIGSGDYRRGSVTVAAVVTSKDAPFSSLTAAPVNVAAGAGATVVFGPAAAVALVTIRNNDAGVSIGVSTNQAGVVADWKNGKEIGPGEEAEILLAPGATLYARHNGGAAVALNVASAGY